MNCECLDFNEKKLVEHYSKTGVVNPKVSADFLGISMSTGEATISLNYTIRGDNRPYNTQKGKQCYITANYCPWCGKSVKKEATGG
jgi:hypothetical protein